MKKNTGSLEEKNKKENLPDFVETLVRRRRTVDSFLAESGINTPEAFDAFIEQKSNQFSFSDEFLKLRTKIAKSTKNVKPVSAVVDHEVLVIDHEVLEEELIDSDAGGLVSEDISEEMESISNNLEEEKLTMQYK